MMLSSRVLCLSLSFPLPFSLSFSFSLSLSFSSALTFQLGCRACFLLSRLPLPPFLFPAALLCCCFCFCFLLLLFGLSLLSLPSLSFPVRPFPVPVSLSSTFSLFLFFLSHVLVLVLVLVLGIIIIARLPASLFLVSLLIGGSLRSRLLFFVLTVLLAHAGFRLVSHPQRTQLHPFHAHLDDVKGHV